MEFPPTMTLSFKHTLLALGLAILAGNSLAAKTPARLMAEGDALPDSRYTYAIGRLVLWSAREDGLLEK